MDIIGYLYKLRFIGPFPKGIEVLLVSIPIALAEARTIDPDITESQFKALLEKNDIFVFSSLEAWERYKTIPSVRIR